MAEFYAYRIICGKTTINKVPARLRDDVKVILIDLGYSKFAEE